MKTFPILLLAACSPAEKPTSAEDAGPAIYLDCAAGDDADDGLSPGTAWASLARLSDEALMPGEQVLLARGSACAGTLTLSGSGTEDAPIAVGAWGEGVDPILDGTGEDATVSLRDQSWIALSDLDLGGSARWGVYVGSSTGEVDGIALSDLSVHDVVGGAPDAKGTGLVVFSVESEDASFSHIEVADVEAWNTNQWSGLYLYGTAWRAGVARSDDIRFHDNTVHDVGGDGIVVFGADDAVLDSNLAYNIGLTDTDAIGTPNGVWTWDCHDCTVQYNEAWQVHSPGADGGAFDIDWDTVDNTVQYNYGHDNDGYCVAVFGAEGSTTTGAVVRYNLCADNNQSADRAYQGEIFLYTWDGGALGDVRIYNNTVLHDTAYGYPPLEVWSAPGEGSGIWNNLFVTNGIWMATVAPGTPMGNNLYWQDGATDHAWFDDGNDDWFDGLAAWQAGGQDADSVWGEPLLVGGSGAAGLKIQPGSEAVDAGRTIPDDGGCDAFGGVLEGVRDIGAEEFGAEAACVP